jgi:predicted amidohydrolase
VKPQQKAPSSPFSQSTPLSLPHCPTYQINEPARYHLNNYRPTDPAYIEQTAHYKRYIDAYCALASELHVCIVPGTIVERHAYPADTTSPHASAIVHHDASGSYTLLNVAYFISHTGRILDSYAKRNLWDQERLHLSPGPEAHRAIDTPVGRVGLLACWDLAFPEAWRALVADGAEIIVVPTCWTLDESSVYGLTLNPGYEKLVLDSLVTARCFENTCAVVFANAGGPEGVYVGLSQVAVPFRGPVGRMGGCEEGVLVVDIEMEVLVEAERNYQVRADMGRADWHYRR